MGKLILVTGGARSGKSAFAQKLAQEMAGTDVAYIATAVATDGEMRRRIDMHRNERPAHWTTYELPEGIPDGLEGTSHALYLLDCLTVYLTNILFGIEMDWQLESVAAADISRLEAAVEQNLSELLNYIGASRGAFIIVTNEVGSGIVPETAMGRLFRDIAGRANQRVAAAAGDVYLVVSGIPVKIKGQK